MSLLPGCYFKRIETEKPEKKKPVAVAPLPSGPSTEIRNVDFNNYTYRIDDEHYTFTAGQWSEPEMPDASGVVSAIHYGELMNNGREQAVVALSGNWDGGKVPSGSVQVFDYYNGKPWEVAEFDGTEGEIIPFPGEDDILLCTNNPIWAPGDPQCCPSLRDESCYQWTGDNFQPRMGPVVDPQVMELPLEQ